MPGCYGNREFRTIHMFYCRFVQGTIAYFRKYKFFRGFICSAHLKSRIVDPTGITDLYF